MAKDEAAAEEIQANGEEAVAEKSMYIRMGSKRAGIYNLLAARPGEAIPADELNPSGKGTAYAVKKLNEKLIKTGDAWTIRRSKDGNVVSYGLYEKAAS